MQKRKLDADMHICHIHAKKEKKMKDTCKKEKEKERHICKKEKENERHICKNES